MSIRNMTHSFRVDIAEKIGLNAAVILSNLMHWVIHNKENGRHFYDEKYWTYNSVEAFGSLFPYLTKYQIEKALKDMECEEIIFTGNYNKVQFDRTKWYSVNWQHPIFENQVFDSSKNRNGLPEKPKSIAKKTEIDYQETGEPIPDINTYSKLTNSKPLENNLCQAKNLPDPSIEIESIKNQEKKENSSPPPKFQTEVSLIVEYLNDVTGRNFDPEANSNAKFIRARLKDGATVEEMKRVIDFKAREWLENKKMTQYLRPKTLFNRANFIEYLGQISISRNNLKENRRLKKVVDGYIDQQNMVFSWDVSELESLEKIAARLKGLMKERGDPVTPENLEVVLLQMLNRMDKFYKKNFSLKLINSNLNKILNGAKDNKEAEWESFMANFN